MNFRSEAGQNPTSERNCRLIWSNFNPEKAKFGNKSSFTVSEFNNAIVKIDNENYSVYLDGELLAKFFCITDIYLYDITGDGIPEMCFNTTFGSGLIDLRISAIDCSTGKEILSLSDRGKHDYTFAEENGSLIIVERGGLYNTTTRTGTLTYDGGNVSVDWGRSVSTKAYCFNINTLTDGPAHPFTVLRSRSDVENYLIRYSQTEKDYIELKNCLDSYGEEFFRSNHIVIISTTLGENQTYSGVQLTESWNSLYAELLTEESVTSVGHGITPVTVIIPVGGQLADNPAYNFN